MSRTRRRVRDDLVDVVFDVIRTASAEVAPGDEKAQAEREAARQAARAEKRRQHEQRSIRSYIGVGAGLLIGGLTFPMIGAPAAVGAGLLAGGLAQYVTRLVQTARLDLRSLLPRATNRPRAIAPPEVDGRDLPKSQRDLVQRVLDDAAEHLQTLETASERLARSDAAAAEICRRLVADGEKLSDAVADAPGKFPIAQRALTYYLERAANTAIKLEAAPEEAPSRDAWQRTLSRVEMYLEKTILDLHSVDEAEMDLDMRMLNQALDEDLGAGKTP